MISLSRVRLRCYKVRSLGYREAYLEESLDKEATLEISRGSIQPCSYIWRLISLTGSLATSNDTLSIGVPESDSSLARGGSTWTTLGSFISSLDFCLIELSFSLRRNNFYARDFLT